MVILMNKEEFELKLQQFLNNQVYIMAYRFNYDSARIFNDELIDYINLLQQENQQLKNNWDKLKEYIKENSFNFEDGCGYVMHDVKIVYCDDVLDKMQELEKGNDNEK